MYLRIVALLFFPLSRVLAQNSVSQCALACITDVSGTSCSQAQWSCLCQSHTFLERTSTCAKSSCNAAEYDVAISAIKQLCAIFQTSLTVLPYATASALPTDQVFSTVANGSSLASVSSTSTQLPTTSSIGNTSSRASASVYPTSSRASSATTTGLTPTTASSTTSTSSTNTATTSSNAISGYSIHQNLYAVVGVVIAWVL